MKKLFNTIPIRNRIRIKSSTAEILEIICHFSNQNKREE